MSPDLIQHKPGEFHLEQCGTCNHIFQNPRLSLEGLDFYYRDFYDGLSAVDGSCFWPTSTTVRSDISRRRWTARGSRWLDVTATALCLAQERWPETAFEGVDMGSEIEEAGTQLESRPAAACSGLAPAGSGRYDVVSMHHYLEHTRDPKAGARHERRGPSLGSSDRV